MLSIIFNHLKLEAKKSVNWSYRYIVVFLLDSTDSNINYILYFFFFAWCHTFVDMYAQKTSLFSNF